MASFEIVMMATDAGFTATLNKARREMLLTSATAQAMNSAMAALRTGTLVGAGSIAALVIPTVMATKAMSNLQASIQRAATIGGEEWTGRYEEISAKIAETAAQFGISMEDMAEGIVEFAKAGFSYEDTMNNLIIPTTRLAMINQTDFATAARTTTYAWQLYGKTLVEQGWQVIDVFEKLNVAANESMLDIEELGHAIEYAGSNAVVAGIKYNEFLAAIAALRQLAYQSDQTLGTLINRILVSGAVVSKTGKTLEQVLGAAPGSVVKNGIVNLAALMEYLEKLPDKFEFTTWAAENWGVRSTTVFNVLANSTKEYHRILGILSEDTSTLTQQSEEMAMTLPALFARIKNTILKAVIEPELVKKATASLDKLLATLRESDIPEKITFLLAKAFDYLISLLPRLVDTVSRLADKFIEFAPTLFTIAEAFTKFLSLVSKIPAAGLATIAMLTLMNKIMPQSAFLTLMAATRYLWLTNNLRGSSEALREYTMAQLSEIQVSSYSRMMKDTLLRLMQNEIKMRQSDMTLRSLENQLMNESLTYEERLIAAKQYLAVANNIYKASLEDATIKARLYAIAESAGIDVAELGINVNAALAKSRNMAAFASLQEAEAENVLAIIRRATGESTEAESTKEILLAKVREMLAATTTHLRVETTELAKAQMLSSSVIGTDAIRNLRTMNSTLLTQAKMMSITISATTGLMTVMMAFSTNASTTVKAISALAAAFTMLSGVLMAYSMAKNAAAGPPIVGTIAALALGAAMMTSMASMVLQSREMAKGVKTELGSAKGGFVESEGWRYIHEGEYIVKAKDVAEVDSSAKLVELSVSKKKEEETQKIVKKAVSEAISKELNYAVYEEIMQFGETRALSKYSSLEGGYVKREGWRYIHTGEYIIPPVVGKIAIVDEKLIQTGEKEVPGGISRARAIDYALRFKPEKYIQKIKPEWEPSPQKILDKEALTATVNLIPKWKKLTYPSEVPVTLGVGATPRTTVAPAGEELEAPKFSLSEFINEIIPDFVAQMKGPIMDALKTMGDFFGGVGRWLGENLGSVKDWFVSAFSDLGKFFGGIGGQLGKSFLSSKEGLISAFGDMGKFLGGLGDSIGRYFEGAKIQLVGPSESFGSFFANLGTSFGRYLDSARMWFSGAFDGLGGSLDASTMSLGKRSEDAKGTLSNAFGSFGDFFGGISKQLGEKLSSTGSWLSDSFGNLGSAIRNAGANLSESFDGVKIRISDAFSSLSNAFKSAISSLGTVFDDARSVFQNVLSTATNFIEQFKGGVIKATEGMSSAVSSATSSLASAVSDAFKGTIDTIKESSSGVISSLSKGMKNIFSFQEGGEVKETGLALLHEGEYVVRKEYAKDIARIIETTTNRKNLTRLLLKSEIIREQLAGNVPVPHYQMGGLVIFEKPGRRGGIIQRKSRRIVPAIEDIVEITEPLMTLIRKKRHAGISWSTSFDETKIPIEWMLKKETMSWEEYEKTYGYKTGRYGETIFKKENIEKLWEEAEDELRERGLIPPERRPTYKHPSPEVIPLIDQTIFAVYPKLAEELEKEIKVQGEAPSEMFAFGRSLLGYATYKNTIRNILTILNEINVRSGKGITKRALLEEMSGGLIKRPVAVGEKYWAEVLRKYMYSFAPALIREGFTGELKLPAYRMDVEGLRREGVYYDYRNVNIYDVSKDELMRVMREAGLAD